MSRCQNEILARNQAEVFKIDRQLALRRPNRHHIRTPLELQRQEKPEKEQ
jgi:hypothetical protein